MRVAFGAIIWLLILFGGFVVGRNYYASSSEATGQLAQFLTQSRTDIELQFANDVLLCVGDPIIHYDDNGIPSVVGTIEQLDSKDSVERGLSFSSTAYARLYSTAPSIHQQVELEYHRTPDSMDWVVQMMLPPQTRQKIAGLITDAYKKNQTEIVGLMAPIVEKSVRDAAQVVREEFQISIDARREQIQLLGYRYQDQVVEQQLIPLVKEEIWPVIQQEGQPLATQIGQEIWQQASIWRFGWRMLYDKSPLPEKNLTEKEFNEFLESKAMPILEARVPDIIQTQQEIIKKVAANEKVRAVASNAVKDVVKDPEFQLLVGDILRDIFVNNDRVKNIIQQNWNSAEAQRAIAITNSRLDPTITQIGATLFGNPDQQITPEFSRVLRNKILNKDDRWIVLKSPKGDFPLVKSPIVLNVKLGQTSTENPFHVPSKESR